MNLFLYFDVLWFFLDLGIGFIVLDILEKFYIIEKINVFFNWFVNVIDISYMFYIYEWKRVKIDIFYFYS